MVSGRVRKFVNRLAEKFLKRFYEGPEPPQRLREIVLAFALEHPRATVKEWVEFASLHGEECYRTGYIRGHERAEREEIEEDFDPRSLVQSIDPNWRWRSALRIEQGGGMRIVSAEEIEQQDLMNEQIQAINSRHGRREEDERQAGDVPDE